MEKLGPELTYVIQEEQLGTGDAVKAAKEYLDDGEVIVLCGDTPLLNGALLKEFLEFHRKEASLVTVLTAETADPAGYGRVIRNEQGKVIKIVEEKDATVEERAIKEINTGTYCFYGPALAKALGLLSRDNKQKEYYLTDVLEILDREGKVTACKTREPRLALGVNNREQLAEAAAILREFKNRQLMDAGVTLIDPRTTYIDVDVEIGPDTVIYPNTFIEGKSRVGKECSVGPATHITDSMLGDKVVIRYSVVADSSIGDNVVIGPFANIRPGSSLDQNVKIGDFVEVKKSSVGEGTKIPHLSYIGDAEIGGGVNIGAGTIVVNYDGKEKHMTRIGSGAFIGCNSNLVAPVTVGDESFVAAGSTITEDVPPGSLAISRARQVVKAEAAYKYLKTGKRKN
ncbi:MAG TPA: bifunctional UDP-N-acetylglucosamine diphosphorylase/glucosamine-1-phosphate N-acetyltransferase GlmU, partial [Firmicutes bacterium]|nr:bifunctional UDP-N-acetylglucosamine diphosphorylase/glucosamine-1-phosphate N-acetyltransferase GlmU [Bacillota bacterium]